jgi:hypothetical protein
MTEDRDQWADKLSAEHSGGWLTGFFAEEERLDRRAKLRLASWGVGSVGAVTLAILASQFSAQLRREQVTSADLLTRQAQQIQSVSRETQTDSRRLAAAIDTLNGDRDRLFSRVTSVEQGLESVTGAIKRQTAPAVAAAPSVAPTPAIAPTTTVAAAAAAPEVQGPQTVTPPPLIGPVSTVPLTSVASVKPTAVPPAQAAPAPVAVEAPKSTPAIGPTLMPVPLMAEKSMMAPPDSAATPLSEPPREIAEKPEKAGKPETVIASVQPAEAPPAPPEQPAILVQRTEFGVDLGGANSIDGLRALWRGMVASNKALGGLRPIIVLRERAIGLGMQLRLVAGPLGDAAAAAKLCAALSTGERSCETSVFEGQRLAMRSAPVPKNDSAATVPPPAAARPVTSTRRKHSVPQIEQRSEAPAAKPEEPAPKPQPSPSPSLTSFLGLR